MDRHDIAHWWAEALDDGVWWAPWRQAIDGLTAEEAAWSPAPDRHSIWDLVNHMTHWHEYFSHRVSGGAPTTEEELDGLNWQPPTEISDEAWASARERFLSSHARVRTLMADPRTPPPPKPQLDLRYLLLHDSYHVGQIMYIRALLGKDALES